MSKQTVTQSFGPAGSPVTFDRGEQILHDAGKISKEEEAEMKVQVAAHPLDPKAKQLFDDVFAQLPDLRAEATAENAQVVPAYKRLLSEVKTKLTPGKTTKTFGGTLIPEAVKTVMNKAIADGAVVYDVRQLDKDPFYNFDHEDLGPNGLQLTGVYSPYAQEDEPKGPLAFSYTELTPEKLEAERTTVQTFTMLDTSKGFGGFTEEGGKGEAIFKKVTETGSARIDNRYDTAFWSDPFARGEGKMKWAGNFAIGADGAPSCVPASRRSSDPDSVILTTASLARGKLEVFNGHLFTDDEGTVTYVGKSGRLRDFDTVDPVAVLKAWGFKLAPGLTVTQE